MDHDRPAPEWPLDRRPGFLVRRLYQVHVALFAEHCARFGVTPVQYSLMSALARRGDADQSTLAADVVLDKTTTAGVLKRLEARGFVRRSVDASDRRSRRCSLSDEGKFVLMEIEPHARQAHAETLKGLDEAERALIVALMSKAVRANADRPGASAFRDLED